MVYGTGSQKGASNLISQTNRRGREGSTALAFAQEDRRRRKERPRLAVFRSLHHIYAQVIDDTSGATLVAASTLDPEVKKSLSGSPEILLGPKRSGRPSRSGRWPRG